jgi:hypothetical protein
MLDSDILEVAIGLSLMFALVSTICMVVREWLESLFKTRASFLEYGIRQLLNDPHARGLARDVFDHPLVSGLYIGNFTGNNDNEVPAEAVPADNSSDKPRRIRLIARNRKLPSYIPAKNFAMALLDVVARGPAGGAATELPQQQVSLALLRGNLAHIENQQVRRVLLMALDSAEGDINRLRTSIEVWYDSAMDRVSGWYKRSTQQILLVVSFLTVALLNVNALSVADYLFRHDTEREALVASIQTPQAATQAPQAAGSPEQTFKDANTRLDSMHLPIGWSSGIGKIPDGRTWDGWGAPHTRAQQISACGSNCGRDALIKIRTFHLWRDLVAPLVGWLITAFAATLGAPFWFDVLSKFMTVRSTLKPRADDKKTEPATNTSGPSIAVAAGSTPAGAAALQAAAATLPVDIAAPHPAHDTEDSCGVGANSAVTPDDQLPAATGGVR